jgi:predicted nucleotide-binding protein
MIEMKHIPPFPSRDQVTSGAKLLKTLGHSGLDELLLDLGLESADVGSGSNLVTRATSLAKYALSDPEIRTAQGISLQSAIVAKAGDIYRRGVMTNISRDEREAFRSASAVAGTRNDATADDDDVVDDAGEWLQAIQPAAPTPILAPAPVANGAVAPKPSSNKVFIVHGHRDGPREAVARFLSKLGLEPIILHEQANRGDTVIEKFESHSDVAFAVVLLTADDTMLAEEGKKPLKRARQNVLLEWGYFIAKLTRRNVVALLEGDVELPSDIHGIVWEPYDTHGAWQNKLARELKAAGFLIDAERLLK